MTANEIDAMMKATGLGDYRDPPWDQVLWGNGDQSARAIAVCWASSLEHLRQARKLGCDLLVTHEPLYTYDPPEEFAHAAEAEKRRFLNESGMTVYRCHDVWDVMPEVGIPWAWARHLGFDGPPAAEDRFLLAYDLPAGSTVGDMARRVLEATRDLGQEHVGVIGEAGRQVRRIALGTGAITPFRRMAALDADLLVLTDDGVRTWELGQWARDTGVAALLVNHATAEEPGMRSLAQWLAERVDVPVHHVPCGCMYRSVLPKQGQAGASNS